MYEWFKSLTGAWGQPLLDFYLSNSAWINTFVVLYGVLLLFAWRTNDLIERRLIDDLLANAHKNKPASVPSLSWEDVISGIRYPWVASRGHLILKRLTVQNIESIIDLEELHLRARIKLDTMDK